MSPFITKTYAFIKAISYITAILIFLVIASEASYASSISIIDVQPQINGYIKSRTITVTVHYESVLFLRGFINIYSSTLSLGHAEITPSDGLSGNRSFTSTLPLDGTFVITATLSDDNGRTSTSVTKTVDSTPPPVPTGLQYTFSGGGVNLSWNTSTDTLSGTLFYKVYKNGNPLAQTNAISHMDTIVEGVHKYKVSAIDRGGNESAPCQEITVLVDTQPPSTPTNLSAVSPCYAGPELFWDTSTDPSGIKSYRVYRGGYIAEVAGTSTSFIDNASDGTYTYQVSAIDNTDRVSGLSNTISVVVDSSLFYPPKNLRSNSPCSSGPIITWEASTDPTKIQYYSLFRLGRYIGQVTGTTYTDNADEGTHTYTVAAVHISGKVSNMSNQITVKVDKSPPSAPSNLTAQSPIKTAPALSWDIASDGSGSGIQYYKVYRDGVNIAQPNTTSYTDNMTDGTYKYKVTAVDNVGWESGFSNEKTVVVDNTSSNTTISLAGTSGLNDWYTSGALTVSFSSADPQATINYTMTLQSGVKSQGTYSAPLNLNLPDGIHLMQYYSTDLAGNVEPTQSRQIKIDKTPPSIDKFEVAGGTTVISATIKINLSLSDTPSGLDKLYVRDDSNPWKEYPVTSTSIDFGLTLKNYDAEKSAVTAMNTALTARQNEYNYASFKYNEKILRIVVSGHMVSAKEAIDNNLLNQLSSGDKNQALYLRDQLLTAQMQLNMAQTAYDSMVTIFNTTPPTTKSISIRIIDKAGNISEQTVALTLDLKPTFTDVKVDGKSMINMLQAASTRTPRIDAVLVNAYKIDEGTIKMTVDGKTLDKTSGLSVNPLPGQVNTFLLSYSVPETLSSGSHEVELSATDVYNNAGTWASIFYGEKVALSVTTGPRTVPNPFKPRHGESTVIEYGLSDNMDIKIIIFDITGKTVWQKNCPSMLPGGQLGPNTVSWDGKTDFGTVAPNGVYVYFITSHGQTLAKSQVSILD